MTCENISIVIPIYNEEENLFNYERLLLPEIASFKNFELILVNDGSSDRTLEIATKLKLKYDFVKVVTYNKNMGMGYAMKQGFASSTKDFIVVLDSDLTFHPKYIKELLESRIKEGADCVIGSHFIHKDGTKKIAFHRLVLHKIINHIYYLLFGKKVRTISSIFRLYKRNDLRQIKIESNGFNINSEILFKLIILNKKIVEVPVQLTKRIYGVSKINILNETKNHMILIIKILKWKMFS